MKTLEQAQCSRLPSLATCSLSLFKQNEVITVYAMTW